MFPDGGAALLWFSLSLTPPAYHTLLCVRRHSRIVGYQDGQDVQQQAPLYARARTNTYTHTHARGMVIDDTRFSFLLALLLET